MVWRQCASCPRSVAASYPIFERENCPSVPAHRCRLASSPWGAPIMSVCFPVNRQYCDLVEARGDWRLCDGDATRDFVTALRKSSDSFRDTMKTLKSGLELRRPDGKYEAEATAFLAKGPTAAAALLAAAEANRLRPGGPLGGTATFGLSPEAIGYFADLMRDWCVGVERYVTQQDGCFSFVAVRISVGVLGRSSSAALVLHTQVPRRERPESMGGHRCGSRL